MVDYSASFAAALLDVATEENCENTIYDQLQQLANIWEENSDFQKMMKHPEQKKQVKLDMIHSVFQKKLHPVLLRFLEVCIAHDQAGNISQIVSVYEKKRRQANNIELVKVESATTLDQKQTDSLIHVLEERLQKKVELQVEVVPELIAGLRVQTENLVLDNSILSRMNVIKEKLKHIG